MKRKPNAEAVAFLHNYLAENGGCANCVWIRQIIREQGFTNGQIRCAVIRLRLQVQRDSDNSSYARTFDGWILRKSTTPTRRRGNFLA